MISMLHGMVIVIDETLNIIEKFIHDALRPPLRPYYPPSTHDGTEIEFLVKNLREQLYNKKLHKELSDFDEFLKNFGYAYRPSHAKEAAEYALTIIDLKTYLERGKPEVILVLQNYCNSERLLSDLDVYFSSDFRSNERIKVKIKLFANSLKSTKENESKQVIEELQSSGSVSASKQRSFTPAYSSYSEDQQDDDDLVSEIRNISSSYTPTLEDNYQRSHISSQSIEEVFNIEGTKRRSKVSVL